MNNWCDTAQKYCNHPLTVNLLTYRDKKSFSKNVLTLKLFELYEYCTKPVRCWSI